MSRVLTSEAFMLVNGLDIQHSGEWEDYLEMNAQINGLTREEYAAYYLNTQWQMQCMESIVTLFEAKKVTRKQLDKALGEITRITQDLKATVLLWKDAKENGNGAKEKEHLDTLKKLNAEKKEAEKEVEGFIKGLDKNVELDMSESVNEGFSAKEKSSVEAITVAVENWLGDYDNVEDFREFATHSTHKDSKEKEKIIAKALSKLRIMNFDDGEKEPHEYLIKKKSKELTKHIAMELGQAWESKVNEGTEVTKDMWDKEWPLKKVFGKEYEANFAKRVEAAMSKAKDEEQAEEWAYKNFKQLPNPAKGMTIEESVFNEAKFVSHYAPGDEFMRKKIKSIKLIDKRKEIYTITYVDGETQNVQAGTGMQFHVKRLFDESIVNEKKGGPWPEQLEKGLTHWGHKKGSHVRELKTLPCRIGRNANDYGGPNHAQELADLNMKDPMVKKFFKPKFKTRADGNYVNDYVELIPKKGYLYKLFVGTGGFEYFCLAIKPGEVYIFRKYDRAYNQYEYFQHEEGMSTRSGVFDFKRHREEEQWKWNKQEPESASHIVKVGWGIMDIGLEYTQLELPFEHLKTYESFVTEKKNLTSEIKDALENGLVNVGGDRVKVSVTNKNQYKIYPYDSLSDGDWTKADLRDNFKDLVDDLNFAFNGKYAFSPIDVTNKEWIIELL